MKLEAPALLLLAIPIGLLYARLLRPPGTPILKTILHALILTILLLAVAGPYRMTDTSAVDLILVVDRSRSMPPNSDARIRELIGLIEAQRTAGARAGGAGRRLGIVTVGREAHVEQIPQEHGKFAGFARAVDADASSLSDGIETAVNLVGPNRAGKILIFSDGLATGRSPLAAGTAAASRGIAVDYRLFSVPRAGDVAVERIDIPAETDAGASFQWSARIRADRQTAVTYRCYRDDVLLAQGATTVPAGSRPLFFRDRLPRQSGLHRYRVEVLAEGDPVPQNNTAAAVLRANDVPRILLATTHTGEDNVARALRAAGFVVDALPPERLPRNVSGLDAYRTVILEDIGAGAVGSSLLRALRTFVEEGGGGLLVTGGKASFGVGGYFKSPLDPILPVSMEMRMEHRKFRMAMAIVLDRSGSMMADVGGGLKKMDLANRGAAEALGLLTPMDEAAIVAVDSSAHIVVPLKTVDDPSAMQNRVLKIQSEGGGIFVYTGLLAGGKVLEDSTAGTRHIVLFADAADAEEPGQYQALLERYAKVGITVSVIGLGTEKDVDADFLKDVAARGNGRIFFTSRAEELPRLFAQETLSVARSAFVEDPTTAKWMPDVHLLGEAGRSPLPALGGYNLTYLRPEAALAAMTEDEYKAPLLAFWHRGVGRAAAFTGEADGPTSAALLDWPGYGALFSGLGRWLMGPDSPEGVSVTPRIEEPDVVLTLEFDPTTEAGKEILREAPILRVVSSSEEGDVEVAPFRWVGERRLEARYSMKHEGAYLPMVRLSGGQVLRAPPTTLPYSPEFMPRTVSAAPAVKPAVPGAELLQEIAARTGGRRRESVENVFDVENTSVQDKKSLRMALALFALILLLAEVAARRLRLWDLPAMVRAEILLANAGTWTASLLRSRPAVAPSPEPEAPAAETPIAPPAAPQIPAPAAEISDALAQAKKRARRRFGE